MGKIGSLNNVSKLKWFDLGLGQGNWIRTRAFSSIWEIALQYDTSFSSNFHSCVDGYGHFLPLSTYLHGWSTHVYSPLKNLKINLFEILYMNFNFNKLNYIFYKFKQKIILILS